jgi:hypothetical protein
LQGPNDEPSIPVWKKYCVEFFGVFACKFSALYFTSFSFFFLIWWFEI